MADHTVIVPHHPVGVSMSVIALDIGGTKISGALFSRNGKMLVRRKAFLEGRSGYQAGKMVVELAGTLLEASRELREDTEVDVLGVCVPGIVYRESGSVWAPNIPGWSHFPLKSMLQETFPGMEVFPGSDRTCHMLGEWWQGAARGCCDAVLIAVGTGIGAGILSGGRILHGSGDIAGAAGWMALEPPYDERYGNCGFFEYHASGNGIADRAGELLIVRGGSETPGGFSYPGNLTARDVFAGYDAGDPIAHTVISKAIQVWGMAAANFVSLFNPEKIVWGGGVFGPAIRFIEEICREAGRWAQPLSMKQVTFEASQLGEDAGLYGAAFLALRGNQNPECQPPAMCK